MTKKIETRRRPSARATISGARPILEAFGLKESDLRRDIPYADGRSFGLPDYMTSKEIRRIGTDTMILDRGGLHLGDMAVWLEEHPEAPLSLERFGGMVEDTGLKRRTAGYNYPSVSRVFPSSRGIQAFRGTITTPSAGFRAKNSVRF